MKNSNTGNIVHPKIRFAGSGRKKHFLKNTI